MCQKNAAKNEKGPFSSPGGERALFHFGEGFTPIGEIVERFLQVAAKNSTESCGAREVQAGPPSRPGTGPRRSRWDSFAFHKSLPRGAND